MKNSKQLYPLFIIIAGIILLSAWPPRQSPAQSTQPASQPATQSPKKDSVQKITQEIKHDIKSKFDSIQHEIKRIRESHKPRYITQTHTRKVNHYIYDTVMIFIDTCFVKEAPPLPTDTFYATPIKKQTRFKIFFNKIFNHKKPKQDYLKIVDQ